MGLPTDHSPTAMPAGDAREASVTWAPRPPPDPHRQAPHEGGGREDLDRRLTERGRHGKPGGGLLLPRNGVVRHGARWTVTLHQAAARLINRPFAGRKRDSAVTMLLPSTVVGGLVLRRIDHADLRGQGFESYTRGVQTQRLSPIAFVGGDGTWGAGCGRASQGAAGSDRGGW